MKPKSRKRNGKPDPAILADIVSRIVRAAKPEKIVLFGSGARGTMGPDSDLDLLVIKGGKYNHDRVTRAIYHQLSGEAAALNAECGMRREPPVLAPARSATPLQEPSRCCSKQSWIEEGLNTNNDILR